MKFIIYIYIILLVIPVPIFSKIHYAKVEPYEAIELKSPVNGVVISVALEDEGSFMQSKKIIQLEDVLDKENLKEIQGSLKLVEKMLIINNKIAINLEKILKRKESKYSRYNQISTVSKSQKDNEYNEFVRAETQHLQSKEKILNLKKQILQYNYQIFQLKDTISKKLIVLKNKYLYKLLVNKGDYVTSGSSLARIYNIQKAKLTLFLLPEELENIDKKTIYIDDIKTRYKVDKIWDIADKKHLSSYRVEIYIDKPKRFSVLKKIELK